MFIIYLSQHWGPTAPAQDGGMENVQQGSSCKASDLQRKLMPHDLPQHSEQPEGVSQQEKDLWNRTDTQLQGGVLMDSPQAQTEAQKRHNSQNSLVVY